jgi:ketosteroid isomerase-like protein
MPNLHTWPMSANLDLVRSLYAAWERGDFSSTEWAHPQIEYVVADGPSPGTWKGLAGLREGWRDQAAVWDGFRAQPEELDGERVLALSRRSGRGKTSGFDLSQVAARSAQLFTFGDAKVTRIVTYWDGARALADLGLAPDVS